MSMTALAAISGGMAIAAGAQAQSWESRAGYSQPSREERCDCYDYGARQDRYPSDDSRGGYYQDTHLNGDGCSYRTVAHDVSYHDYSTGFRCCADAR